ncbi:MAG: hypothetical protein R3175_09140 [Marinobacter sp.]|uniref:hypothetical protein n=1 Tax=Marinobacter sp. TaxID=50741 RepID=UPI00299E6A40|nr:hypothetical protein [Marinobacter sp.]MDX1756209.1 hypothetical protein [Marinobacter sp.]
MPFSQHHGYRQGLAADFNARYAIDLRFLWQFLETAQGEQLDRPKERYEQWQPRILDRFDRLAKKHGILHLMYPAPLASSSDKAKRQQLRFVKTPGGGYRVINHDRIGCLIDSHGATSRRRNAHTHRAAPNPTASRSFSG